MSEYWTYLQSTQKFLSFSIYPPLLKVLAVQQRLQVGQTHFNQWCWAQSQDSREDEHLPSVRLKLVCVSAIFRQPLTFISDVSSERRLQASRKMSVQAPECGGKWTECCASRRTDEQTWSLLTGALDAWTLTRFPPHKHKQDKKVKIRSLKI